MAFMRGDPPGSTERLMSRLVDSETSGDAPPAFQSLSDCLTECWAFETKQRPQMPSILRRVFQNTGTEETRLIHSPWFHLLGSIAFFLTRTEIFHLPPSRPPETTIETLKDLTSHRNIDAQLLRLDPRTDEQPVDVTIPGATQLDYVLSPAQQHSPRGRDPMSWSPWSMISLSGGSRTSFSPYVEIPLIGHSQSGNGEQALAVIFS